MRAAQPSPVSKRGNAGAWARQSSPSFLWQWHAATNRPWKPKQVPLGDGRILVLVGD
ncbi:MAG: hypothetical protein ACOYMN_00785 [Roseimicrobium sp.]